VTLILWRNCKLLLSDLVWKNGDEPIILEKMMYRRKKREIETTKKWFSSLVTTTKVEA
jgi:hypothetical protein